MTSDDVLWQLEHIRSEGFCNMLDKNCVYDVANQLGFDELVTYIDDGDSRDYMDALEEMGARREA